MKYILIVLLVVGIFNYAVDFFFYLKNRYCRYHIGRWKRNEWESSVERISIRWLHHTPTVKITDNSRYMMLDFLNKKYRSKTIQSWQTAALILGLSQSENAFSQKKAKEKVKSLFDAKGMWRELPVAVDCGMLSYAALLNIEDPAKIKPAMDYSLGIMKKNVNEYRMISYTAGKANPNMYVDTIGLAVPFLAAYANIYNDLEVEELAYKQIELFHKYGMYKNTNFPNHAFNINSKLPLGVYGWGRGVGWYVIGLMDSANFFQNSMHKEYVEKLIREAADNYIAFQKDDGGFGAIIQSVDTYDSSATAVLAWFYKSCYYMFGKTDYNQAAEKCLNCLLKHTRITGAVDWCQGDTKGIGVFSLTYDIMPFAQGMTLRAINFEKSK